MTHAICSGKQTLRACLCAKFQDYLYILLYIAVTPLLWSGHTAFMQQNGHTAVSERSMVDNHFLLFFTVELVSCFLSDGFAHFAGKTLNLTNQIWFHGL